MENSYAVMMTWHVNRDLPGKVTENTDCTEQEIKA